MEVDTVDFLEYTAKENMKKLRSMFNRNENVVKNTPHEITKEEALLDIEYLRYLLENGYSGYEYYPKISFDEGFLHIKKELHKSDAIKTNVFVNLIKSTLMFITDGHFSIMSDNHSVGFYTPYDTYVAGIRVKKKQGEHYVAGTMDSIDFSKEIELFKTISDDKDNVYLIGKRSYEKVDSIEVKINGIYEVLKTHHIKSCTNNEKQLFDFKDINGIAYLKSSTFIGDSLEELNGMYNIGITCSQYDTVVWDLSNNSGGNSEFVKKFIEGLNGSYNSLIAARQLQSSLITAKESGVVENIKKSWKTICERPSSIKMNYKGLLNIIVNDNVASSGEMAITEAGNVKNVKVFGTNTLGIGKYGDVLIYYLPKSNITVWVPHKVFECGITETKGYTPDIWIDSNTPIEDIFGVLVSNNEVLK
jgi:hypothetical protein